MIFAVQITDKIGIQTKMATKINDCEFRTAFVLIYKGRVKSCKIICWQQIQKIKINLD